MGERRRVGWVALGASVHRGRGMSGKRPTPTEADARAMLAEYRAQPKRKRGRPEAQIQAAIAKLLTVAGFAVYSTSQGYRAAPGGTRMTPGLPDLYAVHPRRGLAIWIECKAPGGKLRGAQERFIALHMGAADT